MAIRRNKGEFRPDKRKWTWLKSLYLTRQQRFTLLKWALYALVCLACLVVQDVIMSRFTIFGTTTELAACAILLIAVLEGSELGGLFVIIASTLYYLSGSAPGAFVIVSLTFLAIFTSLLRQLYWRRSFVSILLCAGAALMAHALITFVCGIFMGYTILSRVGTFAMTGLLSWAVMVPLYPLVCAIGRIGGQEWKE